MNIASKVIVLLVLLTVVAAAKRRDPLTEAESDQLREVAMEPFKRLKLLVKFTEARLLAIDEVRADPKQAEGRGQRIHDLLEDFTSLMDEINDNLDQYQGRPLSKDDRKDFHRGLKECIDADARFELKLKALKSAIETDAKTRMESRDFHFALDDAEDALKSSADVAREYIETTPIEKKNEPEKKK
jgi:hypothetical protein